MPADGELDPSYRKSARAPRHEVIRFKTSSLRWFGFFFAALFAVPMAIGLLTLFEQDIRFTCDRDASGAGTCEQVVRYVTRASTTTYDVRLLRGAHVAQYRGKSGPTYRVFVDIDGHDVALNDTSPNPEQSGVADRIDHFARDRSARSLNEIYEGSSTGGTIVSSLFVVIGVGILLVTLLNTAPRRLVLSEITDIAELEQHQLFRWRRVWATKLTDVRGAHVEEVGKEQRIVIDTRDDGALVAMSHTDDTDPAIAAINRIVKGES
jgi:hypothetical protein